MFPKIQLPIFVRNIILWKFISLYLRFLQNDEKILLYISPLLFYNTHVFFYPIYFFSLIEFAFAFFICELKRLFRPFHEFLFVPRLPLWPTILSNKHKPAQGLCAEFMVRHIVCNFLVVGGGLAISNCKKEKCQMEEKWY